MKSRNILLAALALLFVPNVGVADLVVTIGDSVIAPSGTSTLDVRIQSSAIDPRPDYYVIEFAVTAIAGASSGDVRFTQSQSVDFTTDHDYIFLNNSASFTRVVAPDGSGMTVGDFTIDNAGADVSGPGRLLARLEFQADAGAQIGTSYRVSVVSAGTQFQDSTGGDIAYSSFDGTVTVRSVPGPSSFVLCEAAGICLACLRVFRGRRAARPLNSGS